MSNDAALRARLLGVPTNFGANNMGVEMGPNAYRYQQIIPALERAGISVKDAHNISCKERHLGDMGTNPKLRYLPEVLQISRDTAVVVEEAVRKQERMIVLGGDHTTALGAVSGASAAVAGDIGLIYLDAHGDMNTDTTTMTGNIHGMQLASLMGFGAQELAQAHTKNVKVQPGNVLHIGGCDWDQVELDLVARENIPAFTMHDLMCKGLSPLLALITELQSRVTHIWVSLDLDSIDQQYAPAAGMPNKKGLLYREVSELAQYIGKNCRVIGVDVVEYNPLADIDHKTAELATELIANFFGREYSWYTEYLARQQ